MQEENSKDSLQEESKVEEVTPADPATLEESKTEKTEKTGKVWDILQYVGLGLCGLQLIITVVFAVLGYKSVIPKDLIFLATSVFILLIAIFTLLQRWRIPGVVGKVFSVAVSVVLIIGCNYLYTTNKGIGQITENPNKHTDEISVFVKADSGITDLSGNENLIIGLMKNAYGTVEVAVSAYEEKYGVKINAVTFASVSELFTALLNDEIDAAICDAESLGLLAEAEGFEGIDLKFNEIASTVVSVEIKEDPAITGTPKPANGNIPGVTPGETPAVTPDVTGEPSAEPTGEPGTEPTAAPSAEPTGEPSAEPSAEPTGEPSAEPTVNPQYTPTPTPTRKLNYLTYDPYVPYTEYHSGNDHVFTVLINGVDQQDRFVGRGDVNIMVTINTKTHQILMVTTPRDSYLPISCFDWQYDKLTHATAMGGINAAMATLTNLYGVKCDYYVRVNFGGVEALINAIGGVTVVSDSSFTTCYGDQIKKGVNNLNGIQALGFARTRYNVSGGEPARGRHQMEVIRAAIEKCSQSTTILTNYSGIIAAAGKNVKVSIPEKMISSLISNQISTMQGWDIVTHDITHKKSGLYASYALKANAYMSIPDYDSVQVARDYYHEIYNDKVITK